MLRHRLTDDQWDLVQGFFPPVAATGRPPRIALVGARRYLLDPPHRHWRDLPRFGPWRTIWHLFDKWNGDRTLDQILNCLRSAHFDTGDRSGIVVHRRHSRPRPPAVPRGAEKGDPEAS